MIAEPQPAAFPNAVARYVAATRPAFLSVTLVGCLLGLATAHAGGVPLDGAKAFLTVFFALVAHAGVNVVNDYYDALNGSDAANDERLFPFTGGSRFIQNGVLGLREVGLFGYALLLSVTPPGLWLAWHSAPGLLLVGLPYALLVANILYINQFPDRAADARAGKRTAIVRLGPRRARWGYPAIAGLAYALLAWAAVSGRLPAWTATGLATLPLSLAAARQLLTDAERPAALAPAIKQTILATNLHGLIVTVSLFIR